MDIRCQQQVSVFRCQCLRSERSAPAPDSVFFLFSQSKYLAVHSYDLLHCSVAVKLATLRWALPFEYIRDGVKGKLSRVIKGYLGITPLGIGESGGRV
jgi:hypothetical protein